MNHHDGPTVQARADAFYRLHDDVMPIPEATRCSWLRSPRPVDERATASPSMAPVQRPIASTSPKTCGACVACKGLTQVALAERSGSCPSWISRLERRAENPSIETRQRLATGLRVQVPDLHDDRGIGGARR